MLMPKLTKDNLIADKTIKFAVKIVKLVSKFPKNPAGFAIGDQLVRSGTSIGANIQEAQRARSRKDFTNCMSIAMKESSECRYWIYLTRQSKLYEIEDQIYNECEEIVKILSTIIYKLNKT